MKKKRVIGIILSCAVFCALSVTAIASIYFNGNTTIITREYVDSNEWTYITYTSSAKYVPNEVDIKISHIYKANGESSTYKQIKYYVSTSDMLLLGSGKAKIDETVFMDIPASAQGIGVQYHMYAMGNNPSLDCQISGFLQCTRY